MSALATLLAPLTRHPLFRNDTLVVRRRVSDVSEDGIATAIFQDTPFTGTVDPSQSETLSRMLDGASLSGAIMVHTTFPLTGGDQGLSADIVGWKGRSYQVQAVNDWAEGGAGFVSAACTLMPLNPDEPD